MWYKKGEEAKKALERAEKISQMLKEKKVPRFWLKPDEEAQVIFVDDEGFWCEIHTVKIGDRFVDITCSSDIRPCPVCLREGRRPLGVTCFTVIDLRKFVDKDGTIHKYRKVLLPARRTLAKMIFDYKEKYKSLVGVKVTLKRFTSKDPNCGIITEIDMKTSGVPKRYNLASLGKEFATPFNYEVILAPPTEEELKLLGYPLAVIGDTPILGEEFEEEIEEELGEELEEELEEDEEEIEEGLEEDEGEIEEEEEVDLDELVEEEEEEKEKKGAGKRSKK